MGMIIDFHENIQRLGYLKLFSLLEKEMLRGQACQMLICSQASNLTESID